jgi:toxin CcdB
MTMAQFDVFVNPVPSARSAYPFVVAMQSDHAATSTFQLVAPIAALGKLTTVGRLAPKIEIQGKQHVVLVPQMGVMRSRYLSAHVATLAQNRGELLAAIDLLFFGV